MDDTTTTEPQDDPRTRRRRLAQGAFEEATEALATAREALDALRKAEHSHNAARATREALEALLPGFVAHKALELHAGELRSDFQRKATLAMADHLLHDLRTAWDSAVGEVSS